MAHNPCLKQQLCVLCQEYLLMLFLYILIFLGSCDVYTVCVHSCSVVAPNFNSPHPQASRNWEESLGIKNEPAQNGQSRAGRLSRRKKKTMEKGQSWKIIVFSLCFFSVKVEGEQEWSVNPAVHLTSSAQTIGVGNRWIANSMWP